MKKTLSLLFIALLCLALLPAGAFAADVTDTYTNTFYGTDGYNYFEDNDNSELSIYVSPFSESRSSDGYCIASKTGTGSTTSRIYRKNGYLIKEIRFTPAYNVNYKSPLVVKPSASAAIEITNLKANTPVSIKDINSPYVDFSVADGWLYAPEITVILGKGSTITVTAGEGGTASSSDTLAESGTLITLTATPNDGYRLKEWQSEQVTVGSNNTFTMPDKAVTVKAVFEKTPAPVVTPKDAYVVEGETATFTASADGTELTYQWYVDRGDGSGWTRLDGATSAAYTTDATVLQNDGYKYKCNVSGLDSNEAELHVRFTPAPVPKTGDNNMPLLRACLVGISLIGVLSLRKKSAR